MNYAIIENSVVVNIISLLPQNEGEFPGAVPCDGYAVEIGDSCVDGRFYHDGEEILSDYELLMLTQTILGILYEGETPEGDDA